MPPLTRGKLQKPNRSPKPPPDSTPMPCPLPRWRLHQAVRHLRLGGLIAYPTEGVYGLGCDPWNLEAVVRIQKLKSRPADKGLILIAAEFRQLLPFLKLLPEDRMERVLRSWPGPVTWLLPAASACPWWIRGVHDTVAVRVTNHPITAALCQAFGAPLVSTSTNPAKGRPARKPLQVRRYFSRAKDLLIVPGSLGKLKGATPIFDAVTGRCLRS